MSRDTEVVTVTALRPRPFFYLVVLFVTLSSFSYGYGISELNALQGALTCYAGSKSVDEVDCIPLSDTQFGLVTALFTVGGLVGSATLPLVKSVFGLGLRGSLFAALALNATGNMLIASATSGNIAGLGRLVTGFGSGFSLVAVPVYLNDISPPSIKGSIGVLNQVGNVVGIVVAQSVGVALASQSSKADASSTSVWRLVPVMSSAMSLLQFVWGLLLAVDGPLSTENSGVVDAKVKADVIRQRLWIADVGTFTSTTSIEAATEEAPPAARATWTSSSTGAAAAPGTTDERQPLLSPRDEPTPAAAAGSLPKPITIKDLFTNAQLRPGMWMIVVTQVGQQLSGLNAILYYSSGILGDLFADYENRDDIVRTLSVSITVVNALMTFPPILLVHEKVFGRKALLLLSTGVSIVATFVLGLGLELSLSGVLAASMIMLFVMGFAVGLGPVPFLILPELVPPQAASLAGSVGLSINWISNILLAASFLPLRSALSYLDGGKGGLVYWVFAAINVTTFTLVRKYYVYRGEE